MIWKPHFLFYIGKRKYSHYMQAKQKDAPTKNYIKKIIQ